MPNDNRLAPADRAFHDWYRFVLAYPPHFVREYLGRLSNSEAATVLDPFCGTGTTLVEAKKLGVAAYGVDANSVAAFASRVKTDWRPGAAAVRERAAEVLSKAAATLSDSNGAHGRADFLTRALGARTSLIPAGFISEAPLGKVLALKGAIDDTSDRRVRELLTLALADVIVNGAGNVGFGPEVYRTKAKKDAPVLELFQKKTMLIATDLEGLNGHRYPATTVREGDARTLDGIPDSSIDIVLTSPPYPNEKDYTRTTRLESVLLGFIADKHGLRVMKEHLLRSNTRNVFKSDNDGDAISGFKSITALADTIEQRRRELGKTSGFERQYAKVTRHYFGGMYRHLEALWPKLRPGARCAYVVGDQMSYFQVPIRTGALLAELAQDLGYAVEGIDLWRYRRATATGIDLREEVVMLQRPA